MESNCPKCNSPIASDVFIWWQCDSAEFNGRFVQSQECKNRQIELLQSQLAAANSEVERLRKENAELQARYATLANEASNASLHNAFE